MSAAFNEAYSQEKKECRSMTSDSVLRHSFLCKLKKFAMNIVLML